MGWLVTTWSDTPTVRFDELPDELPAEWTKIMAMSSIVEILQ